MKSGIVCIILLFFILITPLSASGKKDNTIVKTQNDEWILCVTRFNTSSLPLDKAVIVSVISREIVQRLKTISYRTRISPEYAYYEEFAWSRARTAAAKAIASKMDERSAEVFKGDPGWRYRRTIAKIDDDLIKLRGNLTEIENSAPLINKQPVFKLTGANLNLSFPAVPAKGGENKFCADQRSDAFLSGTIIDFYGRFLLSLKLYTLYTQSYVWEDSIIFSQENIDDAVNEIIQKLSIVLSGNEPAFLTINAEPDETLILINRSFAGRGSVDKLEMPPSAVTITASAPDHESVTLKTVLSADEITEININLNPIKYVDVEIAEEVKGRVYHGALYVGAAPLTLRLPVYSLEYFEMETANSHRGSIVFETPDPSDNTRSFSIRTRLPLQSGRVDKDRRIYYWTWAGIWFSGITYWIANHTYNDARSVYLAGQIRNPDFYNDIKVMQYVRIGALSSLGAIGAYSVYRFIRYIYTANRGSTPLVSPGRK